MTGKPRKNAKQTRDRPSGVMFRDDGNPRWEVRIRWQVDGEKRSLPVTHYPVDMSAPKGSVTHIQTAEKFALRYAEEQWEKIKLGTMEWSNAAHRYTLGDILKRYQDDVENGRIMTFDQFKELEAKGKITKRPMIRNSIRREMVTVRIMLGTAQRGHNKQGFPDLCNTPLNKLTYEMFYDADDTSALNWRLKNGKGQIAGNSTIRSILTTLRSIFNIAIRKWKLDFKNVLATLKDIPLDDGRDRTLSESEMDMFYAQLQTNRTNPNTLACIMFIRQTGARRSEACKLEWANVDLNKNEATFIDTKSKKGEVRKRTIPLEDESIELLNTIRDNRPINELNGPVFVVRGKALRPDTVTQAWRRTREQLAEKTGDKTFLTARIHDLRHTRITELGMVMGVGEVAAISGHRDLASFKRYFNPTPEILGQKLKEVRKIEMIKKNFDILSTLNPSELSELIEMKRKMDSDNK